MIIISTTESVYYPVAKPRYTDQITGSRRVQYVRRSLLVSSRIRSKGLK
jgi:hypothetical protein